MSFCIQIFILQKIESQRLEIATKVPTFLVITQVSKWLKKSHILIFSKYKYLHVKIASLANIKSCVTIGPTY